MPALDRKRECLLDKGARVVVTAPHRELAARQAGLVPGTGSVPAKLAARARLLGSSSARKTDVADAISVATVALHNRRLNRVQLENQHTIMRLLTERRDDLVAEHTR